MITRRAAVDEKLKEEIKSKMLEKLEDSPEQETPDAADLLPEVEVSQEPDEQESPDDASSEPDGHEELLPVVTVETDEQEVEEPEVEKEASEEQESVEDESHVVAEYIEEAASILESGRMGAKACARQSLQGLSSVIPANEMQEIRDLFEMADMDLDKLASDLKDWYLVWSTGQIPEIYSGSRRGSRGMQINRKDKDLMSDTGGTSKNHFYDAEERAPREDERKPWRPKRKPADEHDPDIDNDPDLRIGRRNRKEVDFHVNRMPMDRNLGTRVHRDKKKFHKTKRQQDKATLRRYRGSMEFEAGIMDVLQKAKRRFPKERLERIVQRLQQFLKTKKPSDDLDHSDVKAIYGPVSYGEKLPLSNKRDLAVEWTDHAEYRSDLRGLKPKSVNRSIRDWLADRLKSKGPDSKKVRMDLRPGTAVVDYDLKSKPSEADVITVWASDTGVTDRVAACWEA